MILIILEDQYANKIALDLQNQDKNFKIPIKWNIKNPEEYIGIINKINNDYVILLDNYFPGSPYEEPLGDVFLQKLLKTGKNYKIICISDRGKRLVEEYEGWRKAEENGWIIGWCPNKDGKDVYKKLINVF